MGSGGAGEQAVAFQVAPCSSPAPGVLGPPADPDGALGVLREAADLAELDGIGG